MQPRGGYLYGNGNGNGKGNGSGFRYGGGQPYRPPVPPEQQMTPQEREAVLLAAGRFAAEYLVIRGDLPPNVLENRPPAAPIPLPGVGGQPTFGFGSQYRYQQQPPVSRTFQFQGRPPAPQHRQPQPWSHPFHFQGQQQQQRPPAPQRRFPGPRPFQGGRGPFPKRPRQRPFPYGPPGRAPPQTRYAGQAAAAPVVAASKNKQDDDNEHSATAREAGDSQSQPTAQPDVPASGTQQTDEPSSSSLGANEAAVYSSFLAEKSA